MGMIIGKYVATLEIDVCLDENMEGLLPFEEIKKNFCGSNMEKCLTEMLIDELGEAFTVSVNTQHIDLYKKDGDGNA